MKAVLAKDGVPLARAVETASSFRSRLLGLIGRKPLDAGCALYISPCGGVHTFLMRFNLDLVFLDRDYLVVRIAWNVPPNRIVFGGRNAHGVLEMTSGWLPEDALKQGDKVTISPEGKDDL